ncbi:hypothetical protein sr17437 [Sporisorium reilianum SRZ2]|uniref:Uncharacterized protein n=2 Tax=Sporisorium reilianum TaxID=72558 RepID=E6ZQF5_SPORE|nr:hypothetical protein sr17437 [Sporisorium reilianum SRZ2]SJX65105.1 uncharacterized protein SRS1_17437 [Sporisorium reilianum f. sp. reilianum]
MTTPTDSTTNKRKRWEDDEDAAWCKLCDKCGNMVPEEGWGGSDYCYDCTHDNWYYRPGWKLQARMKNAFKDFIDEQDYSMKEIKERIERLEEAVARIERLFASALAATADKSK